MKVHNKYSYEFEWDSKYCYPNSHVLVNKLNIQDEVLFQERERALTSVTLQELMEYPLLGDFDFAHLKAIHKGLFEDIFTWAGEIRTVNISKGSSFCVWQHIETSAKKLFTELKEEDYLQRFDTLKFPERFAYYFSEINALHPFREGNGRAQRLFLEYLANSLGYTIQFSLIKVENMLLASVESFKGNLNPLEEMFDTILTEMPE